MNRKGFTLVEVLIVVIIIGILAAIGIPQFAASIERAKGGEARAGLGHIQTGEKVYYAEREVYTSNASELDVSLTNRFWNFTIAATNTTYIATATRRSGPQINTYITMNDTGAISGSWPYIGQ